MFNFLITFNKKTLYIAFISASLTYINCISQSNVELLEYSSSNCKEDIFLDNFYKLQNRILERTKTDHFHTYKIFVVTNCNFTEKGKIELKNDTLNLILHGRIEHKVYKEKKNDSIEITIEEWTESIASCDCAFNLFYKIKGLENKDYVITLNGEKITQTKNKFKIIRKQPTFSVIDNDTINYVDIYGLKQGLHIDTLEDGRQYSKIKYKDDQKISGLTNTFYNFEGFDRVETFMINKKYSVRKYYNKEKLIKTCKTNGDFEEETNCKYEK